MDDFNILRQVGWFSVAKVQHQPIITAGRSMSRRASSRRLRKVESAKKETLESAKTEAVCAVDHGIGVWVVQV